MGTNTEDTAQNATTLNDLIRRVTELQQSVHDIILRLPEEQLLTADEVAAILRVTRHHLYSLVRHRTIAAHRVGRTLRFKRRDIREYLLRHKSRTQQDIESDARRMWQNLRSHSDHD